MTPPPELDLTSGVSASEEAPPDAGPGPGRVGAAAENDPIPETAAEVLYGRDSDPDEFGAVDVPNESERSVEERMVEATAPDDLGEAEDPPMRWDDYDEGEASDALDAWTIEDLDGATWAARKLQLVERQLAERKRVYTDQRARLDAWVEREKGRLEADARFFRGRLEGFHRAAIAANPKAKTIALPDGTELTSLAGKLAVEVPDPAALVAWAEANELADDLLRYPDPEPNKVALAKYGSKAGAEPGEYAAFSDVSGEEIPGVVIVRKERSYNVKGPVE